MLLHLTEKGLLTALFPQTLLQPLWLKQFGVAATLVRAYHAPLSRWRCRPVLAGADALLAERGEIVMML
jgi:hypothetical protein